MGVELFLLDDGWFGNKYPRVNDNAGLGDWEPNRQRLPNGLAPLAAEAIKQGLRFGIWMEPEMVNPKSELFDQHPDWVIRQPKRELELQRNQLVLDLTRPEVQAIRVAGHPGHVERAGHQLCQVGLQSLPHPARLALAGAGPPVPSVD